MTHMYDRMAERIFTCSIMEGRAGELLQALFDGGSATVDDTGKLVIVPREAVQALMHPRSDD